MCAYVSACISHYFKFQLLAPIAKCARVPLASQTFYLEFECTIRMHVHIIIITSVFAFVFVFFFSADLHIYNTIDPESLIL